MLAMTQNNLCWTFEAVLVFYFALFMTEKFETTLVVTSTMLTVMTICYGITNIVIPKVIARIIPKYTFLITIASISLCAGCIASL